MLSKANASDGSAADLQETPATKVIMIAAFASMDSAIEAVREKVDDYFPKSIKIRDLKACIERLLGP